MRRLLCTLVLCILATVLMQPLAWSDVFIVNPDGSGDFTHLQTALDAVPDHSTLVLQGDHPVSGKAYLVNRSVRLLGDGGRIYIPTDWLLGDSIETSAALIIDTGPEEAVLIEGIPILCTRAYSAWAPSALLVRKAGCVSVVNCSLQGGGLVFGACEAPLVPEAAAGLGLLVLEYARSILIARSTVRGSGGFTTAWCDLACNPFTDLIGYPGGSGMDVSRSDTTIVLDSLVQGGNADLVTFQCGCETGIPPTSLTAKDGGHGIIGDVYASNSEFYAGDGGIAQYDPSLCDCVNWNCDIPVVDGQDGIPIFGNQFSLVDHLDVNEGGPGDVVQLVGTGFLPDTLVIVFVSTSLVSPLYSHQLGWWFLSTPLLMVTATSTDAAGSFTLDGTVPDDDGLSGLCLHLQACDGDPISEPEALVIGH